MKDFLAELERLKDESSQTATDRAKELRIFEKVDNAEKLTADEQKVYDRLMANGGDRKEVEKDVKRKRDAAFEKASFAEGFYLAEPPIPYGR